MSEPMITIKKADGTFAKVPLSEFTRAKRLSPARSGEKTQAAPKSQATASVIASHSEAIPSNGGDNNGIAASPRAPRNDNAKPAHHQAAHHPAPHHAPAHIKPHTEHAKPVHHPAKQMSRADAGSPLEEKLKVKTSAPLFSPKREKQVEEVMGKLGFSVVPDVLGRLKSLVLAKLKDIKSEDETRELLSRSIKNGGLGLTEQQVEKIIKACREVEGGETMENADVPALKGNSFSTALHTLESELELPAPNVIARSEATKQSQGMGVPLPKRGIATAASGDLAMTKESVVSKIVGNSIANETIFKLDTKPVARQSMQDVTASSNEMGPVEEIKSITLTDFRRLSGNPEEAAKRLQQKMFNLQEESFVWYLDAVSAYHVSPLYSEYMQAVCQSLAERKSLANVLTMKNSIKLDEVVSLLEMERGL